MENKLYKKSFLKIIDFTKEDIMLLLDLAAYLKKKKKNNTEIKLLSGKNIALIFEKSSTRTRISFEVACFDQGANVTYLGPTGSQIGYKESMTDTARVLGRIYDGIQYRGFAQSLVKILSEHSGVPVYNGLTDEFHPTQGLADLLTMLEHSDKNIEDISYTFVGDCRFNMANTHLLMGALMGMDVRLLCPDELKPSKEIVDKAYELAKQSGAKITITEDKDKALDNTDFIHTDVWVSMGEDDAVWQERITLLESYQVNTQLIAKANNKNVKFMHCLPAFHNTETSVGMQVFEKFGLDGIEVTNDVFEADYSIVFDQAENRLHTIKSILVSSFIENLDFIYK